MIYMHTVMLDMIIRMTMTTAIIRTPTRIIRLVP